MRARNTIARDIGSYNGYAEDAWNDEVLVGDRTSEWASVVGEIYRDAEDFTEEAMKAKSSDGTTPTGSEGITTAQRSGDDQIGGDDATTVLPSGAGEAAESANASRGTEGASTESPANLPDVADSATGVSASTAVIKESYPRPVSRTTPADKANDVKSLSRKLDRTLYLLVRNSQGRWVFPGDVIKKKEALNQVSLRQKPTLGNMSLTVLRQRSVSSSRPAASTSTHG